MSQNRPNRLHFTFQNYFFVFRKANNYDLLKLNNNKKNSAPSADCQKTRL